MKRYLHKKYSLSLDVIKFESTETVECLQESKVNDKEFTTMVTRKVNAWSIAMTNSTNNVCEKYLSLKIKILNLRSNIFKRVTYFHYWYTSSLLTCFRM